jgi:hypothetical protein
MRELARRKNKADSSTTQADIRCANVGKYRPDSLGISGCGVGARKNSELTRKFLEIRPAILFARALRLAFAMERVTMKLSAVRQEWPDFE